MEILSISLIIISVNIIITTLIFSYFGSSVLERFKQQNKFDNEIIKYINNIYNIMELNGLNINKEKVSDK